MKWKTTKIWRRLREVTMKEKAKHADDDCFAMLHLHFFSYWLISSSFFSKGGGCSNNEMWIWLLFCRLNGKLVIVVKLWVRTKKKCSFRIHVYCALYREREGDNTDGSGILPIEPEFDRFADCDCFDINMVAPLMLYSRHRLGADLDPWSCTAFSPYALCRSKDFDISILK